MAVYQFIQISIIKSVNSAIQYGPDDSGIKFQWERDFPCPSRPIHRNNQTPVQRVPALSQGVKMVGACCNTTHPLLALRLRMGCSCTFAISLCSLGHVVGWSLLRNVYYFFIRPHCILPHIFFNLTVRHSSVWNSPLKKTCAVCATFINYFVNLKTFGYTGSSLCKKIYSKKIYHRIHQQT